MVDLSPDLPFGLYERIVTERLRERLSALDARLVVRGPLDPADADPVLVRTVGEALGRALRGIRGNDQERLAAQIALCNDVVAQLARSVPQAFDGPGDQVHRQGGAREEGRHQDHHGARRDVGRQEHHRSGEEDGREEDGGSHIDGGAGNNILIQ